MLILSRELSLANLLNQIKGNKSFMYEINVDRHSL